jgi:tellurite resistance protein
MSATSKKPTKEKLASYAAEVRKELKEFRQQDEVFGLAVQLGFLAANADGSIDSGERQTIIDAVDILSQGVVIELEVDTLIDEAKNRGSAAEQAETIGERLKELGQAEAGLLFGAFVAQASSGIDQRERKVLRAVGKAAGIADKRIRAILKTVGDDAE